MRKLFLFISCLCCFKSEGQFVVINDPNSPFGGQNQNIRPTASTSQSAIDQLASGDRIVCLSQIQGGSTPAGGNYWYKVDIPTNGTAAVSGYVTAGFPYIVPLCSRNYITINNPNTGYINVRSQANESSSQVLIDGGPAHVINGQRFALVSNSFTVNGNYRWYQIYLTRGCSRQTGWIAGFSLASNRPWVTVKTSNSSVLTTPVITRVSNITNTQATLSITNTINYYYRTYNVYLNGNYQQDYNANGSNSPAQITVTGLTSGTSYNIRVSEKNNADCSSGQSNSFMFTTSGSGCNYSISPTSNTNVPANGSNGNRINISTTNNCSWTASASGYSWITLTSGSSGSGNGNCIYTVANNPNSTSRTGIITIAGKTFTVTQAGTSGCIAPNIISHPVSPATVAPGAGTSFSVSATSGTTPYSYHWQVSTNGGSTWNSITSAGINPTRANWNTSILTLSGVVLSNNNDQYMCIVSSGSPCNGSSVISNPAILTVASNPTTNISINYSNTVIPPWQRENDDYNGQVSVNRTNSTASWHLEVDVLSSVGVFEKAIIYPSITASTQIFNTVTNTTSNNLLKQSSVEGKIVRYYAVMENTTPLLTARVEGNVNSNDGKTSIIQSKWVNMNYAYYNDIDFIDHLKIPVKWDNIKRPSHIKFFRVGNVAFSNYIWTAKGFENTNSNRFSINSDGYVMIDRNNSNIEDPSLLPGDFGYELFDINGNHIEYGYFDLTKVGRIGGAPQSNKIIIVIGGVLNEMEKSAFDLKKSPSSASSTSSSLTYSVSEYCRANAIQFSTWYIAQGNTNSTRRNAYDIGIAMQKIISLNNINTNNGESEIVPICHSKGGLDIRALLAGKYINTQLGISYPLNESLSGKYFNYIDSSISRIIKKVVFLGTPHKGAEDYHWIFHLPAIVASSPGLKDLADVNRIIDKINAQQFTYAGTNVKYLNITGYVNLNNLHDNVVKLENSANPLGVGRWNQHYQNKPDFLGSSLLHNELHTNKVLNFKGQGEFINLNCTTQQSNLEKILSFILNSNSVTSCTSSYPETYTTTYIKSILSGAKILLKNNNGEAHQIGISDEKGFLNFDLFRPLRLGDTINISANGIESLRLPIDNQIISTKKFSLVLFKSINPVDKIIYPKLWLINQNIVSKQSPVSLGISAQNVNNYYINQHNSDSLFIPLNLTNNTASVSLDTGYNKIIIKYVGIDTISLLKEVYYLPDTLLNEFSANINISCDNSLTGARLYVDNIFYRDLVTTKSTVAVLKGAHKLKFTRFGYKDIVFAIDSTANIDLAMQTFSYSSTSDSSVMNFNNGLNPQYWKSISIKNTSSSNNRQLSIKQMDDSFTDLGLKPQSRKFIFRNLSGLTANYRTAIALDQATTPDKDSVYYIARKGSAWRKIEANKTGITEYDPEVQKVAFDSISFAAGESTLELVLMKKQKAIFKSPQITLTSGEIKTFPLTDFVTDPDSLKKDFQSAISTVSDPRVIVQLQNENVLISSSMGFTGDVQFVLTALHDFIDDYRTFNIKIAAPDIPINKPRVFPNPTDHFINIDYILENIQKADIRLYNSLGQLIKIINKSYASPGYYIETIDIENLPAGVYVVVLNDNKNSAKFVKQQK